MGFDFGCMVWVVVDEGLLIKGGGYVMVVGLMVEWLKLGVMCVFFEEYVGSSVFDIVVGVLFKIDGVFFVVGVMLELIDLVE